MRIGHYFYLSRAGKREKGKKGKGKRGKGKEDMIVFVSLISGFHGPRELQGFRVLYR